VCLRAPHLRAGRCAFNRPRRCGKCDCRKTRRAKCDRFGIRSTSHWTGAAIIAQFPRTKNYIVTRWKTSTRPMLSSLAA
jgi:hypothetical protein